MLPVAATCVPPSARYLRSTYSLGWPLAGYNGFTEYTAQFDQLRTWFRANALTPINTAMREISATGPGSVIRCAPAPERHPEASTTLR